MNYRFVLRHIGKTLVNIINGGSIMNFKTRDYYIDKAIQIIYGGAAAAAFAFILIILS